MNKKYLELLNGKINEDDEAYELIRKEKSTIKNVLVDTVLGTIPSLIDSSKSIKYVFILVISENTAKIYQINKSKIIKTIEVTSWKKDKEGDFKSTTIEHYIYKKYKRIK